MATRKAPTAEETAAAFVQIPNTGGLIDPMLDDESEEDDIASKVRAALAQVPADSVRAKLFRRQAHTRKLEWCEDYTPEEMMTNPQAVIRDTWGPGAYEIRLVGSTGTLARHQLDVAAPTINRTPVPASPSVSDALGGVLERMASMQERILERLSTPQPPPPPAPAPMGMTELLGLLATAKSLFAQPPAPAPADDIVTTVAKIRALKGLSEELNPQGGDPDNPMSLANNLLGVLGEAFKARSAAPANSAPALPMPGIQIPTSLEGPASDMHNLESPAQQQPDAKSTQEETSRLFLEGLAQGVITHAAQSRSPADCAAWLGEVLPDEFVPMLKMPNWLDMLCSAMPALAPHRGYLEQVKPLLDAEFL